MAATGPCINHALLLSIFSDISGRKDCPSQGQPILRDSQQFTCGHTFQMQTNQSPYPPPPPLWLSLSGCWSTCSDHPRARCQTTRGSPCAPRPAEITPTGQPGARLPFLTPYFQQKPQQKLLPTFPSFLLPPDRLVRSCEAPRTWCAPFSREPRVTTCLLSGHHLLTCWPHSTPG